VGDFDAIRKLQRRIERQEGGLDALRKMRATEAALLLKQGHSLRDIAEALGISHTAIAKMVKGLLEADPVAAANQFGVQPPVAVGAIADLEQGVDLHLEYLATPRGGTGRAVAPLVEAGTGTPAATGTSARSWEPRPAARRRWRRTRRR
jgi:hypothetical protein